MVEPISDEERSNFARKAKAAFVLLVGVSAGLITLQADVSITVFLGALAAGMVVGAILVWIVFPDQEALQPDDQSSSRRNRRR